MMDGEIVVIMGYLAAGKSTLVKEFTDQGYFRINRDESGGSIDNQSRLARQALETGSTKVVLDNTYPSVESRKSIIETGKELNVPVRCIWLNTSFEDAQLNACLRMVSDYGKVLNPEEIKATKNPSVFPPAALFAYRKRFEKPSTDEGFASIEKREFNRVWPKDYTNKALLLDYDDTLRESMGPKKWPEDPSHVKVLSNRSDKLKQYIQEDYQLLGVSNQSAIAKGLDIMTAIICYETTNKMLGIHENIDWMFCPHKVPPVSCYCRKPHSGIGAYFIIKYKLDPSQCIMVGDQTSDKTFASRCGFHYEHPDKFFGI